VGWAVGVTEALEATVGSVALEASQGSDIQVSVGTVCRFTEGSEASVGLSSPEWAWVWGWGLDMAHLVTHTAGTDTVDTVTRTVATDMVPHSAVMATGVTATPATTKCALVLGLRLAT